MNSETALVMVMTEGYTIGWREVNGELVPGAAIWLSHEDAPCTDECLHPAERQRYRQLVRPARQREFLATRYAAKQALSLLGLKTPARQLQVQAGCFGQPLLAGPAAARQYGLSLSHAAGGWVAAAAFHHALPLALDIEMLAPRVGTALQARLTPYEQALAAAHPRWGAEALWTSKEALAKFLRTGLSSPFALFEVTDLRSGPGYYETTFHFFPQLRAILVQVEDAMLAVVVPAGEQLAGFRLDFAALARRFTSTAAPPPAPNCYTG